ncbi:FAD dependent oxidoreductase [Ampelomyces quisqualis]|uniref:FAD dependent oxidoreductase n=1 Tax=Ampelomyces quisqualis TaxID=50730 RepID=A0A6A5QW11_AMPQU|nr:FAD dependent oxidoreductase [Ampelomyces quisqualis]
MEQRAQIPVPPPCANPIPSYWHNPKSPLAKTIEPETDNPSHIHDYSIIGSGISGTMIAYNLLLTNPSLRILMLEARETCSGATGRNGGHTKAASYRNYLKNKEELGREEALKIARLEWENIKSTHALAKELGIECESQMCNTVDIMYDQETFEQGKMAIEELRRDAREDERDEGGMAWYVVYESTQENRRKFHVASRNSNPEVNEEEDVAGIFEYSAGRIHAYRFTTSILSLCVQKGLVLATQTPVHSIQPTFNHLWSIHTQFSTLTSKSIILATNAYTPYILPTFQSSIVPLRGQIVAHRPGPSSSLPCPLPTTYSFIYRQGYEYMIPRPVPASMHQQGQDLIIGGGLGRLPSAEATEYGTTNDAVVNPSISTYLRASLPGYFGPEVLGGGHVQADWSGILAATSDGRPFVGGVPEMDGVWVAAGFNGHGMVLCLKSAEALVRKMVGDGWPGWFPVSFEVSEQRLGRKFGGRVDMAVSSD